MRRMRIIGTDKWVWVDQDPGDAYPLAGGTTPPSWIIEIEGDEKPHFFPELKDAERWLRKQEQERGIRFNWEDWF